MKNPNVDQTLPTLLNKDLTTRFQDMDVQMSAMGFSVQATPHLQQEALLVFAVSDFVLRSSLRAPELFRDLIDGGDLQRSYKADEYRRTLAEKSVADSEPEAFGRRLRRFRNREMVRIAWRDITGSADFTETSRDLSNLADACLDGALAFLYRQKTAMFGIPTDRQGCQQELVVLGMGKLGARELNFSSDIDLIFTFPENGQTKGGRKSVTNSVFFSDLCRSLIQLVGAATPEGFVFRVDMGLRPFGDGGPLAMSFEAMESYYQEQGREWERYALIKARACAGNIKSGRRLLEKLKPFVFRRYLDYGTIDSLRAMKHKISSEVARRGLQNNIKLGPGGIREIEFFGQIFQLIRGGVEPALQNRAIRSILKTLEKNGTIEPSVQQDLDRAYLFLRNTENKLQEFSDQQVHKLPSATIDRIRLAWAMGFSCWNDYSARLVDEQRNVHIHFGNLLRTENTQNADEDSRKMEAELGSLWLETASAQEFHTVLTRYGFKDPEAVAKALDDLKDDFQTRSLSREGRDRLDRLVPKILRKLGTSGDQPETALPRITDLLKAIQRRTCYLSLLIENDTALVHLIRLITASPFIASFLSRHPVLLDELLDPRRLYAPPKRGELVAELKERLQRVPKDDLEYVLEELCIFKQVNLLRVVSADVTKVLPLMRVSDRLTYIAEAIVDKVLEMSFDYLQATHGAPVCSLGTEPCRRGFGVVAYGKLGGLELGYDSDLDLVFLHVGTQAETVGGPRPASSTQFFGRLGQRVLHMLTTFTAAGRLYETDMRLRPSGSSGMLVSHLEAFRKYQLEKAWTWEHQALVRARFICGGSRLHERFSEIRREVLSIKRDVDQLRGEVLDMRNRLRREQDKGTPALFDLKNGKGAIVDIEFLVQYLVLRHAHNCLALTRWPDNIRILETLLSEGFIDASTESRLREAYLTYRAEAHRLSLLERPALAPSGQYRSVSDSVTEIWNRYLGE